jgi:hypothetical protein
MGRRKKEVDVTGDVDLLERVLGRSGLGPYEFGAFGSMLETLRQREEEYGGGGLRPLRPAAGMGRASGGAR